MIDVTSLVIGFVIGLVVFGIAIELGMKKTNKKGPASRHTNKWTISEISNPRIMAEYLGDIDIPKDAKVLVNRYKDKQNFAGMDVKEYKGIKGNFIIGDDRALILAGPVKTDEIGFWTVEKEIVEKLNQDFKDMWSKGSQMIHEEPEKNNS